MSDNKCKNCGNPILYDLNTQLWTCPICQLEWTVDEHIDDMSYCIQQINNQQQLIQQLQTKNNQLEKDLIDIKKAIEDAKT